MEKLIRYTIIAMVAIFGVACSEDFLDRNDPAELTYDRLYNTTDDFVAALAGCYQSIINPASYNIYFGDITSDNVYVSRFQPSGALPDLDRLVFDPQNGYLNDYWSDNFTTIQRVNFLLDRIENSEVEEPLKSIIQAEARFLRAYSYFNLTRVFGGVPLYRSLVDLDQIYEEPRATTEEVLDFVIEDLEEAENLDDYRSSDALVVGKATTQAARALMGKVYLWRKDFQSAETVLGEIVNDGEFMLEDFSVLYDPDAPANQEIIFSINHNRSDGLGSPFVSMLFPYNHPTGLYPNVPNPLGGGYGNIEPYVIDKFDPEDKRLTELISVAEFENLGIVDTNIYSLKYYDSNTTFNAISGANTIILRYADVLLMYAEALNENGKTNEAYPYINEVRNRAGLEDLPSGLSQEQMFQALAEERQKEFLLEGDRWFDLVFRGFDFLSQKMNAFIPNAYLEQNRDIQVRNHQVLFPLPQDEIQIKEVLNQNPGY